MRITCHLITQLKVNHKANHPPRISISSMQLKNILINKTRRKVLESYSFIGRVLLISNIYLHQQVK